MTKKILILNRHAPDDADFASSAQEMILAATVYDPKVTVVFLEAGGQQLDHATFRQQISAWKLFGVEQIFILENQHNLPEDISVISSQELAELLTVQDFIFNF